MQLSKEDLKRGMQQWLKVRQLGRTDLYFLVDKILAPPDSRILRPHAHQRIIDHCQKFQGWDETCAPTVLDKNGLWRILAKTKLCEMADLPGSRNNLLLFSRGHLKTTIHVVAHCIQWILNYPEIRILIATSTDEKAKLMVLKIKQHFQFNPRFRFYYPEFCPAKDKISDFGSQTEFTVPNRGGDARGGEPTIMTAAVGKALASTHHDVIKCSDVVTENNIRTPGQIAEVTEWFGYLEPLRERFDSKDGQPNPGWKDVEGTIYAFGDFYQQILDHESKLEQKTWRVTKQSCWTDSTKTASVWPERFPVLELQRIRSSPEVGPVLFASQYELDPVSPETALATMDEIKFFDTSLIGQLMPRYTVFTTVDLANPNPNTRGNLDPDYGVFTTAGFDSDGRCDVLSIHRSRFNQEDLCEMFFLIQKRWPRNLRFKVQKDHYAHALEPLMKREMAKRKEWLNIEYAPISTSISKVWKIQQLQGWFKMGNIRFADNITCKHDLILEILRFPRGQHDDILDTISDLFHDKKGHGIAQVYPDAERTISAGPAIKKFEGFNPETGVPMWHGEMAVESEHWHDFTGV